MHKKGSVLILLLLMVLMLGGCTLKKAGTEKIRDLEYTVLEEAEIPDLLKEEIQERKTEDFKLSCCEDDALYIIRGFGMQETGGYSIQVKELYLADNAIYFDAELLGPEGGEKVEKTVSYPYIVIKLERMDENVVFE